MTAFRCPSVGVLGLALFAACGGSDPYPSMGSDSGSEDGSDEGQSAADGVQTGEASTTGEPESTDGEANTGDANGSTGESPSESSGADGSESGVEEDLDMQPGDFTCLLQWSQVRRFRITNLLGRLDEALAVAQSPTGGVYPVGTVIQLIPTEAMVKRAPGFSAETNDWEFFFLGVSQNGTTIDARGTTEVVNGFGGNCFDCHVRADPQWDLVCETGHGCDPIPLGAEQIEQIQQSDPRCP